MRASYRPPRIYRRHARDSTGIPSLPSDPHSSAAPLSPLRHRSRTGPRYRTFASPAPGDPAHHPSTTILSDFPCALVPLHESAIIDLSHTSEQVERRESIQPAPQGVALELVSPVDPTIPICLHGLSLPHGSARPPAPILCLYRAPSQLADSLDSWRTRLRCVSSIMYPVSILGELGH